MKIPFLKKNWDYNSATYRSIIQKILVCDMESCWIMSEIRNVTFIFQNFQKNF